MNAPRTGRPDEGSEPRTLGEVLLLASLWMLFGFMLWYYLAALHVVPVRLAAQEVLAALLGDAFYNVIPNPDVHYLLQVQTRIPFRFPDGSTGALGFIVNPLIYGYGLPLLFGLVMAGGASLWRKVLLLLGGYTAIAVVQVWGVVWESLKQMTVNFGGPARDAVLEAGVNENVIALCYQLGVLILPPLVPVMVWVLGHWALVERFTGWRGDSQRA